MAQHIDEMIELLSDGDFDLACSYLSHARKKIEEPDLVIAPDGAPYLYRWHLFPYKSPANCYFHIQIASDPERPLHDHPWDTMSVILAGGYDEIMRVWVRTHPVGGVLGREKTHRRRTGNVIHRAARDAHRLVLPEGIPYTMTCFFTGPKVHDWGFWYPDGWRHHKQHVAFRTDGASVHVHATEGESYVAD